MRRCACVRLALRFTVPLLPNVLYLKFDFLWRFSRNFEWERTTISRKAQRGRVRVKRSSVPWPNTVRIQKCPFLFKSERRASKMFLKFRLAFAFIVTGIIILKIIPLLSGLEHSILVGGFTLPFNFLLRKVSSTPVLSESYIWRRFADHAAGFISSLRLSWSTKRRNYINKLTSLVVHTLNVNRMINILRHTVAVYMIQRLIVRSNDITGNMRLRGEII